MSNSGKLQSTRAFTVPFTSTYNTPVTETKSDSENNVAKQIPFVFNASAK
jgi:hypothetical protein